MCKKTMKVSTRMTGQRGQTKTKLTRLEKSRKAAKCRRDREHKELENLSKLLPVDQQILARLDKSTVLRLTVCYLRIKTLVQTYFDQPVNIKGQNDTNAKSASQETPEEENAMSEMLREEEGRLMMEALDGFLIFVGKNGRIIYVSEEVERHTGVTAVEMLGLSALEFIHTEDHRDFMRQFSEVTDLEASSSSSSSSSNSDEETGDEPYTLGVARERHLYIRMKSRLDKLGLKLPPPAHLLTHWSGRLQLRLKVQLGEVDGELGELDNAPIGSAIMGLVAVVRPVHKEPLVELHLDGNMFLSRHDLSMKYIFCDPSVLPLLGYEPDDLIGRTAYEFHNPHDAKKIQNCHLNLIAKGTSVSKYYRFLSKISQWVWMRTRATIIYNADNEPQYVVCLNYVYSEEEGSRFHCLEDGQSDFPETNVQGFIKINSPVVSPQPSGGNESIESTSSSADESTMTKDLTDGVKSSTKTATCNPILSRADSVGDKHCPVVAMPMTSEAVLDHTYPVATTSCSSTELPAGLTAAEFPSLMDSLGSGNLGQILELESDTVSWLEGGPPSVVSLTNSSGGTTCSVPEAERSTPDTNRGYCLAVSDHDYSAKPDMQAVRNQNYLNNTATSFSGVSLDLLEGLDDVEMMDTDLLNSVSFGQTNYATDPCNVDDGDSLLNHILVGRNMECNNALSSSLLIGVLSGVQGRVQSRTTDLNRAETREGFLSETSPDRDGTMLSTSESFAMHYGESSIEDQLKDITARLSHSDPCMGVACPKTVGQTTKVGSRKSGFNLSRTLNSPTFDCVVTPPESPKAVASIERQHQRHMSSPSVPSYSPDSPPHSEQSSSGHPSPTSPTANWGLNKSWPSSSSSKTASQSSHPISSHNQRNLSHKNGMQKLQKSQKGQKSDNKSSGSSLLEQFLLSKEPLNPNKGSDGLFNKSQVTEGISQLNLGQQTDANLLKQLLTGEIDDKCVHQYEQSIIKTRRVTVSESLSPLTPPLMDDMDLDSGSMATDLDLFDAGTPGDMGNLLGPISPDVDMLMQSDLDDILREQSRQEELWLQEYFS